MQTPINIQATYPSSSDDRQSKKAEDFRRFEFNHPLNPFRLTSDETRMHLNHPGSRDMNEGLIAYFKKILHEIQGILTSEEKDTKQLLTLTNELYHEVMVASTIPCTSNINPLIFEHLNYILQLLYDWQNDAAILNEIEKDPTGYREKVSQKFGLSIHDIDVKINYFRRKFITLSEEILADISKVEAAIREEHL